MKKISAALMICVISLVFACSKGNYQDEARAMINDFVPQVEKTTAALDKAASSKEAATALSDFAENMKKFVERGKELEKKYGKKDIGNEPALKSEEEKMRKLMEGFGSAMSKVMMKWGSAPEMVEAIQKFAAIKAE